LSDFGAKDGVHHHLKGGGGVHQSKEHDRWFEQSFWGEEGGLLFIAFFDMDVIVTPLNVDFCEESTSS